VLKARFNTDAIGRNEWPWAKAQSLTFFGIQVHVTSL
jgi:hypothetical protein